MKHLDKVLSRKMRKNEIQENKSMEYAAKFVTTMDVLESQVATDDET